MARDLLKRAKADLDFAKLGLASSDDLIITMAAYHVQQCVEKILKCCLTELGVGYTKTHDISDLMDLFPSNQNLIELNIYDNIRLNASRLTNWEAKTRYVEGYYVKYTHLKDMFDLACSLLNCVKLSIEKTDNSCKCRKIDVDKSVLDDAKIPEWLEKDNDTD